MTPTTLPTIESDNKGLQDESKAQFHVLNCIRWCMVALSLLAKRNVVSILAMGSGKTMTFWLPMLHEKGITFIVTPLKSLGSQLSNESIKKEFRSALITAELLGDKPGLVKVIQSTKVFS